MECAKSFTITVEEAVTVLFTWGIANVDDGGGTGTASFTPLPAATGNTAVADCSTNGVQCSAQCIGQITYTSNAVLPCTLRIIAVSTGSNPDPTIVSDVSISASAPAFVPIIQKTGGIDYNYNDDVTFPFNLPDTGGVPWTIDWSHNSIVSPNPINDGSMSTTGIFAVV